MCKSPLQKMEYFSDKFNVNLFCKREDLYPALYGGNKARIVEAIFASSVTDFLRLSNGYVISAGHVNSNFNRALALKCAELKLKLKLIVYSDEETEEKTNNFIICKMAGADIIHAEKAKVSTIIDNIIESFNHKNIAYEYIYGGGAKNIFALKSYYSVVKELYDQMQDSHIDHVFLPCGTGTTVSGLLSGINEMSLNIMVHAIGIARSENDELPIIRENLIKMEGGFLAINRLKYYDEYCGSGYGKTNSELSKVILDVLKYEGMILDETYSGKAFWGMLSVLKKDSDFYAKKNIVFINTGGLFNFMDRYTKWNKI